MVKLWYAYYLVMQFLVTYIAVYNVLVVSGPTLLSYLENERGKKSYLPYHIVRVIFSRVNYWSGPRVVCVCACRHMCTVCMQTHVYCVHAGMCV